MRKSSESAVTVPDNKSFMDMIEQTDAAVASGAATKDWKNFPVAVVFPTGCYFPRARNRV